MSRENVEIVRAALDAVGRGDWDALLEAAGPTFELDLSRATGPVHGVYRRDQVRALLEDFASSWESLRFEPDEVIAAGEHVVVPWTMHARGRAGVEVTSTVTWLWTVRDGAIVRACMYQERADALVESGLSEG
jgi:ketosteroid isomerase-like protein